MPETTLVRPSFACLPAYVAALEQGWSPDNLHPHQTRLRHLASIALDAADFLDGLDGVAPPGPPPDGAGGRMLPGFRRWIWDGDFCGTIGFRWQPGTAALPPHVLGHIGYAVVPWKRGRGHAKRALAMLLPEARARGLPYVELTTSPENLASQRVILACGGVLVEHFRKPEAYGGADALRFRVAL
ncbi:GNAT family N-acetyltransferase [Roseomonas sp. M0104]|uniref:GNAT family N-acetyltransferase n=1 Tax=Teichococcus coralli TaxID=2545983 RepID=A0A845BA34_9PROT|nr:GNAT family N-acetyltransferase [Pseudoroseomonas coralli]MXP62954.1 GNAT family N-acetyltransferase [Pseudoroseomonas coralli]